MQFPSKISQNGFQVSSPFQINKLNLLFTANKGNPGKPTNQRWKHQDEIVTALALLRAIHIQKAHSCPKQIWKIKGKRSELITRKRKAAVIMNQNQPTVSTQKRPTKNLIKIQDAPLHQLLVLIYAVLHLLSSILHYSTCSQNLHKPDTVPLNMYSAISQHIGGLPDL